MMAWWGDKGIDGFRMDVISMLSKDQRFPDGVLKKEILMATVCPIMPMAPEYMNSYRR